MVLYNPDLYVLAFASSLSFFNCCFISYFSRFAFAFASITLLSAAYFSFIFSCWIISLSHLCFESPRTSRKKPAIMGVVNSAKKNQRIPLRPLFLAAFAINNGKSRISSTISRTIKTSTTTCPICSSWNPVSSGIIFVNIICLLYNAVFGTSAEIKRGAMPQILDRGPEKYLEKKIWIMAHAIHANHYTILAFRNRSFSGFYHKNV